MALTRGQKIGIGVAVVAIGALAFGGAALADDDIPDVEPDEPGEEPDAPAIDDGFDDPLPPKGPTCDYSGCGPAFDNTHSTPTSLCLSIQNLGYPIDCVSVAENGSRIAVEPQRNWIRQFQKHFNAIHDSPPAPAASPLAFAPIAAATKLKEDGLIGNRTIAAIALARAAVFNGQMPWLVAAELAA